MNYFQCHIGDYDTATAHLSALEDGIYFRLIRRYYATETPLPADRMKVARFARLRTKDELAALDVVLEEFFELREDGYHQLRCDEGIEEYHSRGEGKKNRSGNEKERQRRTRERRKQMFETLRAHGVTLEWNASIAEIEEHLSRVTGGVTGVTGSVTGAVTGDVTGGEPVTPVTLHDTAIANNQEPILTKNVTGGVTGVSSATPSSRGSRLTADWQLPAAWLDWCRETWPGISTAHWRKVGDTFRDYWLGKPGGEGRKSDWLATWRNWCRREMERKGGAGDAPQRSSARPDWMKGAI